MEKEFALLELAETKLTEAYNAMSPEDEDYNERMEAATKMLKEVKDAKIELEKIRADKENNTVKVSLELIRLVALAGAAVLELCFRVWSFCRSSKFEDQDAYTKTTHKLCVQDFLKNGPFGMFKKH